MSIRESRGAAVVMMKPVEDVQRDDLPGKFWTPANWLLLVDALMRTGGVVEADNSVTSCRRCDSSCCR